MKKSLFLATGILAALAFNQSANAGGYVTSDPTLPPPTSYFFDPASVHACYATVGCIVKGAHLPFLTGLVTSNDGINEFETFNSQFAGTFDVGGTLIDFTLTGPVQTEVFGKVGHVTGTFDTEMLAMTLIGSIGTTDIMIRESPTLQSKGKTSIIDIGGGLYEIKSYFDINTEVSLDGGQTWVAQNNGPSRVAISEPPAFALMGFGLGLLQLMRKRKAA